MLHKLYHIFLCISSLLTMMWKITTPRNLSQNSQALTSSPRKRMVGLSTTLTTRSLHSAWRLILSNQRRLKCQPSVQCISSLDWAEAKWFSNGSNLSKRFKTFSTLFDVKVQFCTVLKLYWSKELLLQTLNWCFYLSGVLFVKIFDLNANTFTFATT